MTNFEKLKRIVFNYILENTNYKFSLLGKEFKPMYEKDKEFKKELNNILDNIDIRQILTTCKNNNIKVPNKYLPANIDYNSKGMLDFIFND